MLKRSASSQTYAHSSLIVLARTRRSLAGRETIQIEARFVARIGRQDRPYQTRPLFKLGLGLLGL